MHRMAIQGMYHGSLLKIACALSPESETCHGFCENIRPNFISTYTLSSTPSSTHAMGLVRLVVCVSGVYATFLLWAIAQERRESAEAQRTSGIG